MSPFFLFHFFPNCFCFLTDLTLARFDSNNFFSLFYSLSFLGVLYLRPLLLHFSCLLFLLPWSQYLPSLSCWPWWNGWGRLSPPLTSCSAPESVSETRWHRCTLTLRWSMQAPWLRTRREWQRPEAGSCIQALAECTAASERAWSPNGAMLMSFGFRWARTWEGCYDQLNKVFIIGMNKKKTDGILIW